MSAIVDDLRYAARTLLKSPGFAGVAVLTLALGIGANTAIFSVVDALLLRPLPYPDAEQILTVWTRSPEPSSVATRGLGGRLGSTRVPLAPRYLPELRARSRSFASLAGFSPSWSKALTAPGEPAVVDASYVSDGLLEMLGIAPAAGRGFLAEDHRPGAAKAAIVGHALWERRFVGQALDGARITLDGESYDVVGVLPPGAALPGTEAELLIPFVHNPLFAVPPDIPIQFVLGRLAPDATLAAARAEMDGVARALEADFPARRGRGLEVVPLREQMSGDARTLVLVLFGAVALLLLIACANVAHLLLARALGRGPEMAVRAALGAGRGRLVRLVLTESLLLGLAGAAVGVLAARWSLDALAVLLTGHLPPFTDLTLDARVLGYTIAVAVGTSMLFGLAPALYASRGELAVALREGPGKGATGAGRVRRGLIVGEVALSVLLLAGAGLLVRSLWRLSRVDPGFRTDRVLAAGIALPDARYGDAAQRRTFYAEALARVRALPGVEAVGMINRLPLGGAVNNATTVEIEGRPAVRDALPTIDRRVASPGYFATMGIRLQRGRVFSAGDGPDAPRVAIVNEVMARREWPGEDPIGRRARLTLQSGPGPWLTIVGVVGDIRHHGLDDAPRPELYVPYEQAAVNGMVVVARTGGDPRALQDDVRRTVWSLDPGQPITPLEPLDSLRAKSLAPPRSRTLLFSAFAALALLLAAVGIYGVVAYAVRRMTAEVGLRVALGAGPAQIRALVLRRALAPVIAGLALGLAAALLLGRALQGFLFEVRPADPLVLGGAAFLLLLAALAASALPARRAARVDPIVALRYE